MTLLEKGKQPYRKKPWERNKGGKPPHAHKSIKLSKPEAPAKMSDVTCYYCGKPSHFARYCYKKKLDESKHNNRKHVGHFVEEKIVKPDFQNLRLFISEATLSSETYDSNAWFIDSGASIHMSCNKDWFENYEETNNGVNIYILGMIAHIQLWGMVTYL